MAESIHEQIAAAIVTKLAAIKGDDGATFWYTPEVIRTHGIDRDILKNDGFETIYALAPDEEGVVEESSGRFEKTTRMILMLARRHDAEDAHHDAREPLRWTEQARMMHDVDKTLLADTTLAGLTENLEIPRRLLSAEDVFIENWAVVIADVVARYPALATSP